VIVCVYALIAPAPARLRLAGVAGERLRVVTVDRIGAVIGELRRTPAPSVRNLRRWAVVVESIAARASSVLPARFATTVADRDELAFIMHSRRATLRERLRVVRGRAQMTTRLLGSDPDDPRYRGQTPLTSRTGVRPQYTSTQGTQYLQEKMAIAADARAVPEFKPVRQVIQRYVKDERVDRRGGVVTINHLVPRASAAAYRDAVEHAADENGVRLIVTGPWPPYAFADTW
jgi:hypothetical protein